MTYRPKYDESEVVALLLAGELPKAIRDKTGMSRTNVLRIRNKHGLAPATGPDESQLRRTCLDGCGHITIGPGPCQHCGKPWIRARTLDLPPLRVTSSVRKMTRMAIDHTVTIAAAELEIVELAVGEVRKRVRAARNAARPLMTTAFSEHLLTVEAQAEEIDAARVAHAANPAGVQLRAIFTPTLQIGVELVAQELEARRGYAEHFFGATKDLDRRIRAVNALGDRLRGQGALQI